jgi:hypothetical protein
LADDAELALTWQHLGAITIDAKLGAKPGMVKNYFSICLPHGS